MGARGEGVTSQQPDRQTAATSAGGDDLTSNTGGDTSTPAHWYVSKGRQNFDKHSQGFLRVVHKGRLSFIAASDLSLGWLFRVKFLRP